ncbi:MAG: nucleotide-binding domain containing protein, partial [Bryobacteraceae bacterium]
LLTGVESGTERSFAHDPLNPISDSLVPTGAYCEVEEDVCAAARRVLEMPPPSLAAGTGALAGELAEHMEIPRNKTAVLPEIRSCLIMNGSLHDASARQIEKFSDPDWTVMQWTPQAGQSPIDIADENGRRIREMLNHESFQAVLVCGGDTVYGMLKAVGFPPIRPIGEVVPGVPLSRVCLDGRELYLITKAGGFGEIDILTRIRKKLNG